MKLVLDEKDVKEILLEKANLLFPGQNFNHVDIDSSYDLIRKVEIEHEEKEKD